MRKWYSFSKISGRKNENSETDFVFYSDNFSWLEESKYVLAIK